MPLDFPYSTSRLSNLHRGGVLVPDAPAIFRVEGSGALTCLQGLFTCDLAAAGENSLSWGAVLTPKGMISFDAWTIREAEQFILILDASAREAALDHFRRTLPPRLAKLTDLTGTHRAAWVIGPAGRAMLAPSPEPGRVNRRGIGADLLVASGNSVAPFELLLAGPAEAVAAEGKRLLDGGMLEGFAEDLAASRILAGWPTLGREIDAKTLPQEVRFDELGGVSYTKGCYTGQETVARIHFRGHVNRTLRGVILDHGLPPGDRAIRALDKDVGTIRSALVLEDRVMALATIRRELDPVAPLEAGGRSARVMDLPIAEVAAAASGLTR